MAINLPSKLGSSPLKVTKNNDTITITSEQGSVSIPISKIKSFESKIRSGNISLTNFAYKATVSHELQIVTDTDVLSFVYPAPWYSYFKTDYKEVFQLIDMDIPNYKCKLMGNITHINKDIEYYLKHKKRLSFIKRSRLYFLDLPLPMKFLYLLMMFALSFSCIVMIIFVLNF